MTSHKHQKIAGALLSAFAILQLCLLAYMVAKVIELYDQMVGSGLENIFGGVLITGLTLSLGLFLVQLTGGYLLIRGHKKARGWGIAASVIAISTLWAAPAGIYAIWARLQFDKEARNQ